MAEDNTNECETITVLYPRDVNKIMGTLAMFCYHYGKPRNETIKVVFADNSHYIYIVWDIDCE